MVLVLGGGGGGVSGFFETKKMYLAKEQAGQRNAHLPPPAEIRAGPLVVVFLEPQAAQDVAHAALHVLAPDFHPHGLGTFQGQQVGVARVRLDLGFGLRHGRPGGVVLGHLGHGLLHERAGGTRDGRLDQIPKSCPRVHRHCPFLGKVVPGNDTEQRGFSGPVPADNAHAFLMS